MARLTERGDEASHRRACRPCCQEEGHGAESGNGRELERIKQTRHSRRTERPPVFARVIPVLTGGGGEAGEAAPTAEDGAALDRCMRSLRKIAWSASCFILTAG